MPYGMDGPLTVHNMGHLTYLYVYPVPNIPCKVSREISYLFLHMNRASRENFPVSEINERTEEDDAGNLPSPADMGENLGFVERVQ